MTFTRSCRRCDWRTQTDTPDQARANLTDHATASGHPLCIICGTSLHPDENQTCAKCVARTRGHLAGILTLFALLPAHLGQLTGRDYARAPKSTEDEFALPGGTVLGMLAAGSSHHGPDERDSDPESVAHTLGSWEDDWRSVRKEPAAPGPDMVQTAHDYLMVRLSWAGQHHPAFDEFAADLRRVHRRLELVTAEDRPTERAPVKCFDCGQARLEREYRDPRPCPHVPPPSAGQPQHEYAAFLRSWRAAHVCEQGGRVDVWSCRVCGRTYRPEEYRLAVVARLQARAEERRDAGEIA